jgi:hypothetical protein
MRQKLTWVHWLIAALMVLAGGLGLAMAEQTTVEVRQEKGDEVTVVVNGNAEVLTLDGLADGESRTFGTGEGEITVSRDGDALSVEVAGHEIGDGREIGSRSMVWVTADDDEVIRSEDGEHKVRTFVVKGGGEEGSWVQDDGQTIRVQVTSGDDEEGNVVLIGDGGARHEVIELKGLDEDELEARLAELREKGIEISDDGLHKMIVKARADAGVMKAHYRCEDSDEELVVAEDLATAETYVSPVTGCIMSKVDHPEVRVVTVIKTIGADDDGGGSDSH